MATVVKKRKLANPGRRKLRKGSAEAKAYMASIRAKRSNGNGS